MTIKMLFALLVLPGVFPASPVSIPDTTEASVQVVVDPRIELIGIIQLLNDYMLTTKHEFVYKNDARSYFSRFREHPAVDMFREMSGANFNFDAVPKAIIALDDPPDLRPRTNFSEYIIGRAGGEERLGRFVDALRAFAAESQFMSFYEAHAGTYELVLDTTRVAAEQSINVLRSYSGMDIRGTVILGMLLHDGGFAPTEESPDGEEQAYAIIGPVGVEQGLPTFGSERRIATWVSHEFSHTFVNSLTEAHLKEINKYAALYEPIADQMRRQAYPSWQVAVNEHIVRAITTRLAYLEGGEEAGDEAREHEEEIGFMYIGALMERLKEYEAAPDFYSTFAEFYPRLIEVFQEISESGSK